MGKLTLESTIRELSEELEKVAEKHGGKSKIYFSHPTWGSMYIVNSSVNEEYIGYSLKDILSEAGAGLLFVPTGEEYTKKNGATGVKKRPQECLRWEVKEEGNDIDTIYAGKLDFTEKKIVEKGEVKLF